MSKAPTHGSISRPSLNRSSGRRQVVGNIAKQARYRRQFPLARQPAGGLHRPGPSACASDRARPVDSDCASNGSITHDGAEQCVDLVGFEQADRGVAHVGAESA
ncbi:MAG: hypothetical protein R3E68_19245 [Burkholderiaceae bacterium]